MFVFQLFELMLTVATLYYGGLLVLDDVMTGGHLVAFILYQEQLGSCIEVGEVIFSSTLVSFYFTITST